MSTGKTGAGWHLCGPAGVIPWFPRAPPAAPAPTITPMSHARRAGPAAARCPAGRDTPGSTVPRATAGARRLGPAARSRTAGGRPAAVPGPALLPAGETVPALPDTGHEQHIAGRARRSGAGFGRVTRAVSITGRPGRRPPPLPAGAGNGAAGAAGDRAAEAAGPSPGEGGQQ